MYKITKTIQKLYSEVTPEGKELLDQLLNDMIDELNLISESLSKHTDNFCPKCGERVLDEGLCKSCAL